MSTRFVDSLNSMRSSATEEDLEEARQRLLNHIDRDEESEYDANNETLPNRNPPPLTTLSPTEFASGPPINHSNPRQQQWPNNYGSVATLNSQTARRKYPNGKRYRLPFLILIAFDWGMVVFFSIVVGGNKNFKTYFNLSIDNNFFDLVIIATFRFFLNFLFYLVLSWVNRSIMGLTTIASALYVPIKAYYSWNYLNLEGTVSLTSIAILMMLLVTFGMPWITAFFFEFKYLPAELARLDIPNWRNIKIWIWPRSFYKNYEIDETPSLQGVAADHTPAPNRLQRPRTGFSASTVSLDFRTPVGSSRASPVPFDRHGDDDLPPIREDQEVSSSMEHHSPECDQTTMSSEDLRFKREALNAVEAFKVMTSSNEGWVEERVSSAVTIYSRIIERKKVFKAEGIINTSAQDLFRILYPGDITPDWNPQCALNETVYRVDNTTDLVYTVSNAMGPVSCRDFLSIRHLEVADGRYLTASKAIVSAMKTEQTGKVRAENGPCGYLVIPVSANQAKLTWILNSNLKGWLPQSVIDQTLTTVLSSSFDKLQFYAQHRH